MKMEELTEALEANGWKYRLMDGKIEIANPKFGTRKEHAVSAVENSSLQNILLPQFLEACYRLDWKAVEEWTGGIHPPEDENR